jgi:hypothetical protein
VPHNQQKECLMPNTVVSLGDLRAIAMKYSRALNKHNGRRINNDGSVGDSVNAEMLQTVANHLREVERLCGEICQQPVLAIVVTEQTSK